MENYKPAKTTAQMVEYLENVKNVTYDCISKDVAKEILLEYNYINVITPFKHHFARKDNKQEVIKINGSHVYDKPVEFSDYYNLYKTERDAYPLIFANILDFEAHFKSITSYHIVNNTKNRINNSDDLNDFITRIETTISLSQQYSVKRKNRMNEHIEDLKKKVLDYHDVYCYFDRMSIGTVLTIFIGLDNNTQNAIFKDLVKFNKNLGVKNVGHFIDKVFTLVGIRNCVAHNNSLEVLVRFYNPKTKETRTVTDKKKFQSMIKLLSKEKQL